MSNFNFMDLAKEEFGRRAAQAVVTGQKIQSDRGPSKTVASSDAAKVSRKRTKAEKGRKKENERKGQARQAMGAVGDFAASIAAGLLAEAEQKGSGAGFCCLCSRRFPNRGLWQDQGKADPEPC